MIFEIVAHTILAECKSIDDYNGQPRFGEAIKQYPPLLQVCRRFYNLWTVRVRVAGKLLGTELLDLAEHAFTALLGYNPQVFVEVQNVKRTCGPIWRNRSLLERVLPKYLCARGLKSDEMCSLMMYYAPLYLKLDRNDEVDPTQRTIVEERGVKTTNPIWRGQKVVWYVLFRSELISRPWIQRWAFVVDRFRLGPYKVRSQIGHYAWYGISVSYFVDTKKGDEVRNEEGEDDFVEPGRLWLWYLRSESGGSVLRYRLMDYKLGTIKDTYMEELGKISFLEDTSGPW